MTDEIEKPKRVTKEKVLITCHHGKRFNMRFYRDDVITVSKAQAAELIKDKLAVKA
ncbi:MAG: hypothetical protein GY954_17000 [Alteromonas sp.]|nr:hypothetical protein [Alteromonas sp.]